MVQGQAFVEGWRGLALFLFNFFKVYHFCIQKLFYPLENCYAFEEEKNFSATVYNFMKKAHSKLSKNEPGNIP